MTPEIIALAVLGFAVIVLIVALVRKAQKDPVYVQRRFEAPADQLLQWMIDQKWTSEKMDTMLRAAKEYDATKALAGAPIPQEIIEAANKISAWAKGNPQ